MSFTEEVYQNNKTELLHFLKYEIRLFPLYFTTELKDFWMFLVRYVKYNRSKCYTSNQSKEKFSKKFGLPLKFDRKYKVNFVLNNSATFYSNLSLALIESFKEIVKYYIDFQNKTSFGNLQKLINSKKSLPIYAFKDEIINCVRDNQICIIAGDTGCGKSTQVPQYILEAGLSSIACTQPRRIACISLSKRVSYETMNIYGSLVAYKVRFEGTKTKNTKILFLTEGLLLRQLQSDPDLSFYNVVILDEVHERHLTTDFLLGILKCIVSRQPQLKLILMSATINIALFANFFDNAPVIQVPGRLFPIELQYQPCQSDDLPSSGGMDTRPYIRVLQMIDEKYPSSERGDCLIFVSGIKEISSVINAINDYNITSKKWIPLALHSSLSLEEQDRVFDIAPAGIRKVVIATNIAETSVTIDGMRFVVDSGKVKEITYDSKVKMQRLQEFWVSKASAEQRKGRAGRTGPGVCIRLYSIDDYNSLESYSMPEIKRVSLEGIVLQMAAMGLNDACKFPFLEHPGDNSIQKATMGLIDYGALYSDGAITSTGEMLSRLPVDVIIGKMLLMACVFHSVDSVLTVAAGLSVQSVFTNAAWTDPKVMQTLKELLSPHGDPFTILSIVEEWLRIKADRDESTRKWCKKRGIEEQRLYEIMKLKKQFCDILVDAHFLDLPKRFQSNDDDEHFDRKRLRRMRVDYDRKSKKRNVLKIRDEFHGDISSEDDGVLSAIKDLEFRLKNDFKQNLSLISNFNEVDLNLLKIILCSGLYPNFAIPDANNAYRRDCDQLFHTRFKSFLTLHPTCCLTAYPEVFEVETASLNIENENRVVYSCDYQIIAFVSMLETRKPYLCNVLRAPALQTLLLYAKSIDTNSNCSLLIFDEWIQVSIKENSKMESLLFIVIQLRQLWNKLLSTRVEEYQKRSVDAELFIKPKCKALENELVKKFHSFLQISIPYHIKQVTHSEIHYNQHSQAIENEMFVSSEATFHPSKGGKIITEYLTYNCLADSSSLANKAFLQEHWTCPLCNLKLVVNLEQRLTHQKVCNGEENIVESNNSNTEHKCSICNSSFNSMLSLLRHRRSCLKS